MLTNGKGKLFLLIFIFKSFLSSAADVPAFDKTPELMTAPSWIKSQTIDLHLKEPTDQLQDGIFYLLYDHQIQVDRENQVHHFKRFAENIVETKGLEYSSTIKIDFDPSYQQVYFHAVNIIREGKTLNVFPTLKISVLNREQELEKSIYNGLYSYHLIIPDLRVGDVVDYAYSLMGSNPIYKGHFSGAEYLDWSVPVARQHFLVDWNQPNKELNFKPDNTKVLPTITKKDGHPVYEVVREFEPLKKYNSQAPSWHNVYQRIYYSDIQSWDQVVNWALPLYESAIELSPDVLAVVEKIQKAASNDFQKATMSLHYVQSQIRYLGIEMGENSHKPSRASETLARRYGDCKDKAVLLITLLRALGIEASAALVNTSEQREIQNKLPSVNVFDHVIVRVNLFNKYFWIDPTRTYQHASILDLSQSDYGFALVVAPNQSLLQPMNVSAKYLTSIEEQIDASHAVNENVSYQVKTRSIARDAETVRYNHSDTNLENLSDRYINFYRDYYPKIKLNKKLKISDSSEADEFQTDEDYVIDDFWKEDPKGKFTAHFYATGISDAIPKPDEKIRVQPFKLDQKQISETLTIKLEGIDWDLPAENRNLDNPFFNYSFKSYFDKSSSSLVLTYNYKTLVKFIPANEIDVYLTWREKARDLTEYSVSQTIGSTNNYDGFKQYLWFLVLVVIFILGLIYVVVNWFFDDERKLVDSEHNFYAVSIKKFVLINIFTGGLYSIYWMYVNWKQIQLKEDANIFPFWRAFFYPIFLFVFLKRLAFHSGWVRSPMNTALAIGYVLVLFFVMSGEQFINQQILFLILSIGLLVPLVIQINRVCETPNSAYLRHSKFKIRHFVMMVLLSPLVIIMLAQDVGLMPPSEVVPGNKLLQRDLKFLQRNKIVPSSEKIIYFYSSEFLRLTESGCGFTAKHVFVYWHDEGNQLRFETIEFANIKTIDTLKADGLFDEKTIVITLKDGTETTLYIPSAGKMSKLFVKQLYDNWQSSPP